MTDSEAIANLNHIYGVVSPDIQRSLDVAFKALEEKPTVNFAINPDYVTELQEHNKELIKQLEEVERPQGEWIKVKEERMSINMSGEIATRYKCSKCGRTITILPSKLTDYPFCHCGADMRKGGKEE